MSTVAVIDIGTNSTRLLVAVVEEGRVAHELERLARVTRLGRGVDLAGQLSAEAIEDTCAAIGDYLGRTAAHGCERTMAIATSAVRDAENAGAFLAELRERFALDARILDGDEEARLGYRGACTDRKARNRTLVVDIGGGSTELILGSCPEVAFFCSLQAGVVRHTERHLAHDPPLPEELETLADEVRSMIGAELQEEEIEPAGAGIAVAGTPTSLAAIELELDPYDPALVEGHVLRLDSIQRRCSELSTMTVDERRRVTGLHPDRAPTIVAGVVILIQVMRAFGLAEIEVSEHDILHGAALEAAAGAGARPD